MVPYNPSQTWGNSSKQGGAVELKKFVILGGAGFIGSHFVDSLLNKGHVVRVIDNFCSGTQQHIQSHLHNPRFSLYTQNIEETDKLVEAIQDFDVIIHLASNPDIARAAVEPRIDFLQGTMLTESVAEAARITGIHEILYASGSGVYGDQGEEYLQETSSIHPISTYGASKAAGELLLESYSYMFGIRSKIFRFANVVGGGQTHGVGYDFIRQLKSKPTALHILGNGEQTKPYIHVSDIVRGVLLVWETNQTNYDVFNISTPDHISVNEIAEIAIRVAGISRSNVEFSYSGGNRGWKADVPIVRLSAEKIRNLGWEPVYTSYAAIEKSLVEMSEEINR